MRARFALGLIAGVCAALPALAQPKSPTLDAVRQRGSLNCGVSNGLIGFSIRDEKGLWSGFDVDFCKALAAGILKDATKVNFVPLSANERFDALKAGTIDVLSRNSTWTLGREAGTGMAFAAISFHDGQGFMLRRNSGTTSALELNKAKICVQGGTTSQSVLAEYFQGNAMAVEEKVYPTSDATLAAFEAGACDALTTDVSALYAERLRLAKPTDVVILPDIISKEPLGPMTRDGDTNWTTIVRWTLFALINAEELGISSASTAQAATSKKSDVRRFAGLEGDLGKSLGLDNDWALRAVRAVGHYGEIYERNVGSKSRLGIPRGVNQLWSMGGVLYAPPLR